MPLFIVFAALCSCDLFRGGNQGHYLGLWQINKVAVCRRRLQNLPVCGKKFPASWKTSAFWFFFHFLGMRWDSLTSAGHHIWESTERSPRMNPRMSEPVPKTFEATVTRKLRNSSDVTECCARSACSHLSFFFFPLFSAFPHGSHSAAHLEDIEQANL